MHGLHQLVGQVVGDVGDGGDRSHTAGIGAGVALADRFVVAGSGKACHRHAIADGQERHLRAHEALLHQHGAACITEHRVVEHHHQRGTGLGLVLCDDNALARGQSIGLDGDGRAVLSHGCHS